MAQRKRRVAAVVGVAAMVLSACGSGTGSPAVGAKPGSVVLRFGEATSGGGGLAPSQGGGYPTPFSAARGPGVLLTTFMFDTLAFPDVTGQPKPWLAQSWQESPDGKTWTFQLHPNATWQDGQPLTAADVAFSFDYDLHGPGAATGVAQGLSYIQSVTAQGPHTAVVTLKTPEASFLSDIAGAFGLAVVPMHIWSRVTDPAHFQGPTALIGSGAYRLKNFDLTTGTYDFVANDGFYLGRPYVHEIQIVPTGNPLLALQRGQVDAASPPNTSPVASSQLAALNKQYKLLTAPGEFNEALFFNLGSGFPYDQTAFRQAVAYALDRPDMLKRLAGGKGVPGSAGGLGPDNPYLDTSLPDYPHDPARAGALLDQVGLKVPTGGGMRTNPDGSAFTIPLLSAAPDSQVAQLVQQYLRAVGLNVQISSVDQSTSDAADAQGAYKMAIIHFGGLGSDPSLLTQRFASTFKGKSFTRVVGYHNPTFDQLAAQQAITVNTDQRKKLVDQMQAILANDIPELPLYIPEQLTFVNTKVFPAWAYTPACPPCGVGMNKRMLVTGSNAPAPGS
jgi:peptide/nickel transport system substrate-binding protein